MSFIATVDAAPRHNLFKATVVAALVAAALLMTIVLPAEYGIDPTGVGAKLGLTRLAAVAEPVAAEAGIVASRTPDIVTPAAPSDERNTAMAQKAATAFGASEQQSFAAESVDVSVGTPRTESMQITLPPGKGVEVKTLLKAGGGFVYRWTADGEVAIDMHGERTGVKGAWTSYAVENAQRENAGTFVAPFEGSHGWYWLNRGTTPVTVQVQVSGFQSALYQP
jgi:hypothetical protein